MLLVRGLEHLFCKAENWECSAWRKEDSEKTLLKPLSTYRVPVRKMGTDFVAGRPAIEQGTMFSKLKEC